MGDPSRPASAAVGPAFRDPAFIEGDEGRAVRILSEYLQPLSQLRDEHIHDTVVFFGSARITEGGPMGRYYEDARELARQLSAWSLELCYRWRRFVVCSGGGPGIMEAANRGASDAGASSIGLNIGLPLQQRPNPYVSPTLSIEFHYFFMRKMWFIHLARAIVVFPGGFGTIDELFEALTLVQTGKISEPIPVYLYGASYWKQVVNFEAMLEHGLVSSSDVSLFRYVDTQTEAFAAITADIGASAYSCSTHFAKMTSRHVGAVGADARPQRAESALRTPSREE